jgi:ferrochelatase
MLINITHWHSDIPIRIRRSKTGIVMFNMGGPATVPEVGPFLTRLFTDPEIIPLPLQVPRRARMRF